MRALHIVKFKKKENWYYNIIEIFHGAVVSLESNFSPELIAILFTLIGKNALIVTLNNFQKEKIFK
jgi:hypothetical protein